jgi:tetratricopeptide (TPR) repeat protein
MDKVVKNGIHFHNNGDYPNAILEYTKAINNNPEDAKTYDHRGLSYFYNKQYDEAIADYERALELEPDNGEFRAGVGRHLNDARKRQRAASGSIVEGDIRPREKRIGFVKQAIEEHNQIPYELNKILIYSIESGKASGNAREVSRWLWFQTNRMNELLKIPENDPKDRGYYYRYWFRATDSGIMVWKFSLIGLSANVDMREIMRRIAVAEGRDGDCINQITGAIITGDDHCDFSSSENAKTALRKFLEWERSLCAKLNGP